MRRSLVNPIWLVGMFAATIVTFWIPDAKSFQEPGLARMICWHLPCAFITTGLMFYSAYLGIAYLRTRKVINDLRGQTALEMGTLFAVLTMVTGILFSKVQWQAWWQNDPRQTSFLMVLLIFAAGLALRSGLTDERRRAAAVAGYNAFALLPNIFLTFVFPRLPAIQQKSFHPSQTIASGGLDNPHRLGVLVVLVMLTWTTVILFSARVRAGQLELNLDQLDGHDETGSGGPAPDRMVRPVSVSQEH